LASYSGAAACVINAVSESGSGNVEFRLNLDVTGTSDLAASAGFEGSSKNVLSDSLSFGPFAINANNTVTLSLNAPGGVRVFVDGVSQGITTVRMEVTLGNHKIAVPGVVYTLSDARLRFDHWSDGSLDANRTIDLEADESLTAIYVPQYYVTTTPNAVNFRSGWYDNGTTIRFSLNPSSTNQVMVQLGAFNGWYNDGTLVTKSVDGSLTVNGPINLTVEWGFGYIPYIALAIGALIAIGVFLLMRARTTTSNVPIPGDKKIVIEPKKARVDVFESGNTRGNRREHYDGDSSALAIGRE
jgi:hypothetical protein